MRGKLLKIHSLLEEGKDKRVLILELARQILTDFLCTRPTLTLEQAKKMFFELISTVKLLHKRGIAHMDIKQDSTEIATLIFRLWLDLMGD